MQAYVGSGGRGLVSCVCFTMSVKTKKKSTKTKLKNTHFFFWTDFNKIN